MTRLLALALLLACAAACADADPDPDAARGSDAAGAPDLLGSWDLVSGDAAGAPLPRPAGAAATLDVEEDRLSGQAFCNRYFAAYRLDGETLTVDAIGATQMACEEPVMAAESEFLTALAGVDRAALDGNELVLTGPDVTLRFTRQAPVPDRELVGTRWVLDTLLDSDTASSVQEEPLLELAPDGTATFGTGCNTRTGTWRWDGDLVTVDADASPLVECAPELTRQDEHVTSVLTGGATVAVDGDRLTLTAPDGRGLGYRT